jgi:hypothetical protein
VPHLQRVAQGSMSLLYDQCRQRKQPSKRVQSVGRRGCRTCSVLRTPQLGFLAGITACHAVSQGANATTELPMKYAWSTGWSMPSSVSAATPHPRDVTRASAWRLTVHTCGERYAYAANVWAVSIIQAPFSVGYGPQLFRRCALLSVWRNRC